MNRHQFLVRSLSLATLMATGCQSNHTGGGSNDLDQPMFGSNDETDFYISSATVDVKLSDLVAIAKVLRRYKTLDAAEKHLVQLAVERHLDGMIALEAKKIAPKYEAERQRIAKIPDKKEAKKATVALKERVHREAASAVIARLAKLAAVSVKSADNNSLVTFAKITDGRVEVADAAYQLDARPGTVGAGTRVGLPAETASQLGGSAGAQVTVIGGPAVAIASAIP